MSKIIDMQQDIYVMKDSKLGISVGLPLYVHLVLVWTEGSRKIAKVRWDKDNYIMDYRFFVNHFEKES